MKNIYRIIIIILLGIGIPFTVYKVYPIIADYYFLNINTEVFDTFLSASLYIEGIETTATSSNVLCNKVREQIKTNKISTNWTATSSCTQTNHADTGICCSSYGKQWAIWGKIVPSGDYHCIDSRGNLTETGSALIINPSNAASNGIKCK